MARGGKRTGAGRKKGALNKNKMELLERINMEFPDYHPVIAMVEIANNNENDLSVRFQAHKEIAQYVTPKLRSTAIKTDEDGKDDIVSILNAGREFMNNARRPDC